MTIKTHQVPFLSISAPPRKTTRFKRPAKLVLSMSCRSWWSNHATRQAPEESFADTSLKIWCEPDVTIRMDTELESIHTSFPTNTNLFLGISYPQPLDLTHRCLKSQTTPKQKETGSCCSSLGLKPWIVTFFCQEKFVQKLEAGCCNQNFSNWRFSRLDACEM